MLIMEALAGEALEQCWVLEAAAIGIGLIEKGLGWEDLDLQLHSMRRGSATKYFRRTNSMSATTYRGRWANFATCKLYVDAALQDAAARKMKHRSKSRRSEPLLSGF